LIDWAFAAMVPRLRAAGLPRFLWAPLVSPAAQEDLRSYVASFASMKSQEVPYLHRLQSAGDVLLRTSYVESLFSAGEHAFLAAQGWKLPGYQLLEEEKEDEEEPGLGDNTYKGGKIESVEYLMRAGLGERQVARC
ncbi:hypothetical protein SEPCBS57363_001881, partial [Sporothrix epigloea]